jgi:ribosomal protein L37AE/L43A
MSGKKYMTPVVARQVLRDLLDRRQESEKALRCPCCDSKKVEQIRDELLHCKDCGYLESANP